jgi:hypothetical protein
MMLKSKINSKFKAQDKAFSVLDSVHWACFGFCALTFGFFVRSSFAQPVGSNDLINNARQYDGKVVVYAGEIIGDIMKRGDYAWINVLEGGSAIGVWVERSLLKEISFSGSYKSIGDGVEITGVFHRACPEHGGDLDIHAQSLRVTGAGRPVRERLNVDKRNQALIFLGVLIVVWILSRFMHK